MNTVWKFWALATWLLFLNVLADWQESMCPWRQFKDLEFAHDIDGVLYKGCDHQPCGHSSSLQYAPDLVGTLTHLTL